MFRCYWIVFARVNSINLRKILKFDSILDFFFLFWHLCSYYIEIWLNRFVVKSYSSSSLFCSMDLLFFTEMDGRIMPRLRCSCSLVWRSHYYRWLTAKFRPMLGAQGLWAGKELYRATPAVTQTLGFSGIVWKTAPFSRLLWHTRGCGWSILTRILTSFWKQSSVDADL
jgi:hypothetical protein